MASSYINSKTAPPHTLHKDAGLDCCQYYSQFISMDQWFLNSRDVRGFGNRK